MCDEFKSCTLCPRACGVDRAAGETGFCKAGPVLKVARAALHFWEEPCVSGVNGSGAVFFSHCTLGCAFCQNSEISRGGSGIEISVSRLGEIFLELQAQGAHNINLVTPTHFAPLIIEAIKLSRASGLILPFVYNCGGYESVKTIAMLSPYIDVWLPDFKYFGEKAGKKYSAAANYPQTALAAISQMVHSAGPAVINDDGLIERGVIVRHLLLPGGLADSMKAVKLLYESFGDDIIFSLMSQYTPPRLCDESFRERFPELTRKVNERHYEALTDYAAELGITRCYVQNTSSADSEFIPPFHGEGVLSVETK